MTPRKKLELFYCSLKTSKPVDFEQYSNLRGPDLIWLDDQYLNSDTRITVIGQQVGDWSYNYPEFIKNWTVSNAIKKYLDFDFAYSEKEPRFRGTPFWKFFHEVRERAFPNEPNNHKQVLWTNVVKFVARGGRSLVEKSYTEAEEAIQLQEEVLTTELKIAKPQVCLFVTGPDFDCLLRRYFTGLKFTRFERLDLSERQFARLVHPELPAHSYRTYHPNHLNRQRKLRKKVFQILEWDLNWCKSRS